MRTLHFGLAVRNFGKLNFYLLSFLLFCAVFVFNEYFKKSNSVVDIGENLEFQDLTNRRHNRNLQHLYDEVPTTNLKGDISYIDKYSLSVKDIRSNLNNHEQEDTIFKTDTLDFKNVENESRRIKISKKRLPTAIIIGVKKAGTRALLEFLRVHPDIRATGPEPHFFDKNYEKGLQWYRNLMPSTKPFQHTIEKTPAYFVTKNVPERVYNMSESVKLILVVRDPVTRCVSDFAQIASRSHKPLTFENFVFTNNQTTIDTSKTLVKVGMYVKHLGRWLNYFPREQIHVVDGEKLVTNPANELFKIQRFLNIPVLITKDNFYFNQTRGFPCIIKTTGKKPHCLDETKGRKHPTINPKTLKRLEDFYRPLNKKFSELIEQEFNWT